MNYIGSLFSNRHLSWLWLISVIKLPGSYEVGLGGDPNYNQYQVSASLTINNWTSLPHKYIAGNLTCFWIKTKRMLNGRWMKGGKQVLLLVVIPKRIPYSNYFLVFLDHFNSLTYFSFASNLLFFFDLLHRYNIKTSNTMNTILKEHTKAKKLQHNYHKLKK